MLPGISDRSFCVCSLAHSQVQLSIAGQPNHCLRDLFRIASSDDHPFDAIFDQCRGAALVRADDWQARRQRFNLGPSDAFFLRRKNERRATRQQLR